MLLGMCEQSLLCGGGHLLGTEGCVVGLKGFGWAEGGQHGKQGLLLRLHYLTLVHLCKMKEGS